MDRIHHFSVPREKVDVGAVLVADPVGTVGVEDQTFGVEAGALAARPGLAESVAGVGGGGEEGESSTHVEAAAGVGFEAGKGVGEGVGEEGGAFVGDVEVWWCGGGGDGMGVRGEEDVEDVEADLIVQCSLCVPVFACSVYIRSWEIAKGC